MGAETSGRITIRLPLDRIKILEKFVENGKFPTLSDAVRIAIEKLIQDETTPSYIKKMEILLPRGNIVQLEKIVKSGDSVSIDDAIRTAVREYIRQKVEELLRKKKGEEHEK